MRYPSEGDATLDCGNHCEVYDPRRRMSFPPEDVAHPKEGDCSGYDLLKKSFISIRVCVCVCVCVCLHA